MTQKAKKSVFSVSKLGEQMYLRTGRFDLTTPPKHIKRPTCTPLHDRHLRNYYFRKDEKDIEEKKTQEIAADNKVKCTLREDRKDQWYLRSGRLINERDHKEMERMKMRQFLEQHQEGQEMTLADLREQMLDQYVEYLRPVLKAERMRWRRIDFDDEELELELQGCKAKKRKELRLIQSEVQHEWNREQRLREERERRERQKCAKEQRRAAHLKQKLLEQVQRAEKSALNEINKKRNPPRRNGITTEKRAAEQRRSAFRKQKLLEQVQRAEKSALDEINKKHNPPCRNIITTEKRPAEQQSVAYWKQKLLEQLQRSDKSALDEINKKRNPPRRNSISTEIPDARHTEQQRLMKPQESVTRRHTI